MDLGEGQLKRMEEAQEKFVKQLEEAKNGDIVSIKPGSIAFHHQGND